MGGHYSTYVLDRTDPIIFTMPHKYLWGIVNIKIFN